MGCLIHPGRFYYYAPTQEEESFNGVLHVKVVLEGFKQAVQFFLHVCQPHLEFLVYRQLVI